MAELTINTAPAVPQWEKRTTVATPNAGETITHALAPEQTDLLADQQKLLDEQKRIEEQHAAAVAAENTVKSETAQQMADAAAENQRATDQAINDSEKQIDEWRTRMRAANDAYQAAPLPSLFHSGDTGRNVLKAVGLLLGGIGDARMATASMLAGHAAPAHSAVDQIIESSLAADREAIDRLKDNAVMAASGLKDAKEGRQLLLANLETKKAAIYDRIAKLGAARIGAVNAGGAPGAPGTDAATIQKDANVAAWTEKALQARQEAVGKLTTETIKKFGGTTETTVRAPTQAAGGGGVEADKNAANFELLKEHSEWLASQMADLTPADIEGIARARSQSTLLTGNKTAGAVAGTLGLDTEAGLSPKAKAYLDRVSRAEDAIGRLKSGGAINAEEGQRFGAMLTPRPSDKSPDIKMRQENMRKDVEILGKFMDRAPRNTVSRPEGPAAPPAEPAKPSTPAAEDDKARAIRLLRVNPNLPGADSIKKRLGITPADLGGAP
jgi:hypothetical protein